jgi:excisionase family DNA binding protein
MPGQRVEWISLDEAAKALDLSPRRVLDYGNTLKIRVKREINPASKREVALFHAGDVEHLREERKDRQRQSRVNALATINPGVKALLAGAPREAAPAAPSTWRPGAWLTLEEAAEYSRLPASVLLRDIERGALPAKNVGVRAGGQWRVKVQDLEALKGGTAHAELASRVNSV